jgi:hypothetical protein
MSSESREELRETIPRGKIKIFKKGEEKRRGEEKKRRRRSEDQKR